MILHNKRLAALSFCMAIFLGRFDEHGEEQARGTAGYSFFGNHAVFAEAIISSPIAIRHAQSKKGGAVSRNPGAALCHPFDVFSFISRKVAAVAA